MAETCFSVPVYALLKKYVNDSLNGLGALKGAPCTVKSVTPVYSTVDPTKVIANDILLEWTANDKVTKQTKNVRVEDGLGIYDIRWSHSDTTFHYYDVEFYDGSVDTFEIPISNGTLKKEVVSAIPDPDTADDSTFYLVPMAGKVGSYDQYIRTWNEKSSKWEMLWIGSTDVDLTGYQKIIEPTLTTVHTTIPTAINELDAEIGDLATLKTDDKSTIVNAINEHELQIGELPNLEFYDPATQRPENLVEAINMAYDSYSLDADTVVDRTKFVNTYKLHHDAEDGSPITTVVDTVEVPRVDVELDLNPADRDYRSYTVRMGGNESDPQDASNKIFGQIHIPKIQIKKISNPPDDTLAAQYFLSIEGEGYTEQRCGAIIDIAKDSMLEDVTVETVITADTPYLDAVVGEKYIDFLFVLANGTEKHSYIPIKDLIKFYQGKDAIFIDETSDAQTNYIILKIDDPDNLQALTQSVDGLRIAKATTSQYGVVQFAERDEVLNPVSTNFEVVHPYDLYDFAVNSESVDGDLFNLYEDAAGDKVNNTIIASINEALTAKVEKVAVPADENVAEYKYERIPVAGVKDVRGDVIEVPRAMVHVTSLDSVTDPKEYTFYHLCRDQVDATDNVTIEYRAGVYIYENNTWMLIGSGEAIVPVDELPTENIRQDVFYKITDTPAIVGRYKLSDAAIEAGITMDEMGLHYDTFDVTLEGVLASWATFIDDELVLDPDGDLYALQRADGTQFLEYNYSSDDGTIYYYHEFLDGTAEWIAMNTPSIPIYKLNNILKEMIYF